MVSVRSYGRFRFVKVRWSLLNIGMYLYLVKQKPGGCLSLNNRAESNAGKTLFYKFRTWSAACYAPALTEAPHRENGLRELPHLAPAGRPGTMANAGRMSQVDTADLCQGAEQKRSHHSSSGRQMFYDFSVCFEKHPMDDHRAEE